VTPDDARDFVRSHHRAVLATHRQDGSPQLSPVVCTVGAGGTIVVSTRETAMKAKNLARDPTVSLCVFSDDFFGPWIQIDGTAEVVRLPDALELLIDYYRSASGEHPDWDEYRTAMERERRVALRIAVERAGPTVHG